MQLTLQIPDDLAAELRSRQRRRPHILSLGLRELDAEGAAGFSGLADVLKLLASLPTPEQIMALRPRFAQPNDSGRREPDLYPRRPAATGP